MIDKTFFEAMHNDYMAKSLTDDEIVQSACDNFGGLIKKEDRPMFIAFAREIEELVKVKNNI